MPSVPDSKVDHRASVTALVRDFDREPVAARRRIGEILQHQPEIFYRMAIEVLRDDVSSRAAQYLVGLLISEGLLFRALCEPELGRQEASELARLAQAGDPAVDVELARQLADALRVESSLAPGIAERLLEIIGQISNCKHLLPSLMRMLRNSNPYLRSKVVLLIGRTGGSLNWIQKRLQEFDTRVRANAIEAAWGIDTPEARELLAWAARDANNRVVGNALVGMYRLGENSALAGLVSMAAHQSDAFRRTAAWAMGEAGDSRFTEILRRMIGDPHTGVRRVAFAAIRRLREAAARGLRLPEWQVAGAAFPRNPRTGERRVSVAVASADSRESARVLPAQFQLTENGQVVWSYEVASRAAAGPMTVLFLFPQCLEKRWDEVNLRCQEWKRSTDVWSTAPYSGGNDSGHPMDLELPGFIASSADAAQVPQQASERADRTGFWAAIQRSIPSGSTQRGHRHAIVLAPKAVGGNADEDLIAAVRASRTSLQVIACSDNPMLREFCRSVDGNFRKLTEGDSLGETVSAACLSLLARYEIRYRSAADDASTLKIGVQTPAGWGETALEL